MILNNSFELLKRNLIEMADKLTIYAPMIYTALSIMFRMRISITRARGRGLGPGIREFFGPCEMASSR
jgi:hypothetical protein